ncbi:MAG TPA: hypothetical protein VMT88_10980 [Actinomycetes bacterium]|nr:hypothetical protein [Actinomycetes bacterium]
MCSWPANIAFPPSEGEQDAATTAETTVDESQPDDALTPQLDALGAMAARQTPAESITVPDSGQEMVSSAAATPDPFTAPIEQL